MEPLAGLGRSSQRCGYAGNRAHGPRFRVCDSLDIDFPLSICCGGRTIAALSLVNPLGLLYTRLGAARARSRHFRQRASAG